MNKHNQYSNIKVVTICGSMKFTNQMIEIATDLERKYGWCVIQCVYDIKKNQITTEELEKITNAHYKKINISDAIYVVNIDGYLGSATKKEIEYAKNNGKEIIYHEN